MNDTQLIDRFEPVLAAAFLEEAGPDEIGAQVDRPVHAEVLHQLCLADGLLELLDWTRQGVGADPLGCIWLGSLRWYRLVAGGFPDGAPEPPARDTDATLLRLLRDGELTVLENTGAVSLAGLAAGEMAYPSAPAQPAQDDAAALVRVVPIGLVPYIEEEMRRSWVRQAVSLTQGHPGLIAAAERLVLLVHCTASGQMADPVQELDEILHDAGVSADRADGQVVEILHRQLSACAAPTAPSGTTPAAAAVSALAREWERVTRPV